MNLFNEICNHLLEDDKPSIFLNECSHRKEFLEDPFWMLLELKKTEQSPKYHPEGNVWIHTMMVINEAVKVKKHSSNEMVFMLSALLHDVGKPETTMMRKGRITSYDHDKEGAIIAKSFLEKVHMNEDLIYAIVQRVRYHMHILYVTKNMPFWDKEGLQGEELIKDIALLGWCDRMGRVGSNRDEEMEAIQIFYNKLNV